MNKFIKRAFVSFTALMSISTITFAENMSDEVVQKTVTAFMQNNHIPGAAVQIYVNGEPHSYYFGYADQEKKIPVTKDTIFELGSISKIMTSILLAQEVDFAKMDLKASVKKYVPNLSESFNEVTLEDLATYTAGLPFNAPANIKTRPELDEYLAKLDTSAAPGEKWLYSDLSMGMLGYALENETHQDFNNLYQKHILSPLKMQPIALTVPAKFKKFYAQGYDQNGNPTQSIEMNLLPGAAGLKASAGDMQRFLSAAIGLPGTPERLLYPMRMTQSTYVRLSDKNQGLGWQIHELTGRGINRLLSESDAMSYGPYSVRQIEDRAVYNGDALIDKTGATEGFRSYIAVIPNRKTGIVILTNRYVSNGEILKAGREVLFKVNRMIVS